MSNYQDRPSAKILVLGDSGVGKSSLIHLICHDSILYSPQWTIGCSIDVKFFDNYFLEFWDIGGSRGHKIARTFLYNDYHGFMLVFDATNKKSRSNLEEWLAEAMHKANESRNLDRQVPIIYIGTKKDQLPYGTQLDLGQSRSSSPFDANCSVVNFNTREDIQSVIYVDTQDVNSMNQNSTNYIELQKFFRRVISRILSRRPNNFKYS